VSDLTRTSVLLVSILCILLFLAAPVLGQDERNGGTTQNNVDTYKIKDEWKGKHLINEKYGDLTETVILEYAVGDPDNDGVLDGYELLGLKWYQFPVKYTINPSYPVNYLALSQTEVLWAIKDSFESWDTAVDLSRTDYLRVWNWKGTKNCRPYGYLTTSPLELFYNSPTTSTSARASPNSPDYKNVVTWGSISDPNVLAMTTIWYYTATGQMVDTDIVFNTAYKWGIDKDGESSTYSVSSTTFDIRNIATHEAGHVCGLADLYNPDYVGMTMYGYASAKQVRKMSLEPGDLMGIQAIY